MPPSAGVAIEMVGAPRSRHCENSEESPVSASVAVAAIASVSVELPGGIASNDAFPAPSVVTLVRPMKVCPSPNPLASHPGLSKNSRTKDRFGVLCSEPLTSVDVPLGAANVRTGAAWTWLAPPSRLMPSCALPKIEFSRIWTPDPEIIRMPLAPPPLIVFG